MPQRHGVDISLECYPHPAGAGFALYMIPRWRTRAGYAALMARLADPCHKVMYRRRYECPWFGAGWDLHLPARRARPDLVGRAFEEVAAERRMDTAALICELLFRNNLAVGFMQRPPQQSVWEQIDRDIMELIKRPNYMVGSDSINSAPHPHPRTYGCFTRFLRLQREHKFMPLEALINRMTALPARRFGLRDRGEIKRGKAADLVVFDPGTVRDRATYEQPKQLSEGILAVLVNGEIVFSHGRSLGVMAGRALP